MTAPTHVVVAVHGVDAVDERDLRAASARAIDW